MLLAIDTATSCASIALHDGTTLRAECTWEAVRRHTVTLVPHIKQMLDNSSVDPADLQALAVCVGPGSYTGVRIGIAVSKGMAASGGFPLIGITTLDILTAAQPPDPRPMYALFAAGRKRIGCAVYRWHETHWKAQSQVTIQTWEELKDSISEPALVVGELSAPGRELLSEISTLVEIPAPAHHLRRAGFLADLAWTRLRHNDIDDAASLVPLYTR